MHVEWLFLDRLGLCLVAFAFETLIDAAIAAS